MIYLIKPMWELRRPCTYKDICGRLSIHPVCPPKL